MIPGREWKKTTRYGDGSERFVGSTVVLIVHYTMLTLKMSIYVPGTWYMFSLYTAAQPIITRLAGKTFESISKTDQAAAGVGRLLSPPCKQRLL